MYIGGILNETPEVYIELVEEVTITFAIQQAALIIIAANTVTTIVTVIAGWDSINNPPSRVTGRDAESRLEFEQCRALSIAKTLMVLLIL